MNENDTHGGERYCILHVLLVLLEKCNRSEVGGENHNK